MEEDRPWEFGERSAARRALAASWADARRRFELRRLETESRFEAEMEAWRVRADASERDAFDEQMRLARLEMKRGCDAVLESLGERHLPDFGAPDGVPPSQGDLTTAVAGIESALASLDELEAKCLAGVADAARQLETLTEATASIPDGLERESTLETIRSSIAGSIAETRALLADIARQRAEFADWLGKNAPHGRDAGQPRADGEC